MKTKVAPKAVILRVGSRGAAVRKLETRLKAEGLFEGAVDGKYTQKTARAVQRYERRNDRLADGRVGSFIWNQLRLGDKFEARKHGAVPLPQGGVRDDKPSKDPGASGGAAPVPADETGKRARFTTVTANIRSNPEMPQAQVVADVRKAAAQGDLIGWQEIAPRRYFEAIRGLGKEWGHYMPRDGKMPVAIPISWKKSEWSLKDAGFQRTHSGQPKVSPHRYITWVKLKNKRSGEEIIRINTHLVSGAWSKKKADRPSTPWRQRMWELHMTKLTALVERFKEKGHKVVVGGDFNRDSYRLLGNKVAYDNDLHVGTLGGSTLDYLMHTVDPELKHLRTRYARKLHTDHDAVVATYRLG